MWRKGGASFGEVEAADSGDGAFDTVVSRLNWTGEDRSLCVRGFSGMECFIERLGLGIVAVENLTELIRTERADGSGCGIRSICGGGDIGSSQIAHRDRGQVLTFLKQKTSDYELNQQQPLL